ncbi:regulatory protein dnir [Campylobacter sputorum subsp. bubulus]|uniref:Regulatory protein dnir n=1 Tax=Campylobacter sputorum subsp. sputorum TaxID=32024 RepID=A0A381DJ74_9BACT|nr:lytic transglycosylase domain-containing protein [Campylobacter sputorum]ASM35690.1 membrane-bound lytic murein transglycosylase D [Campylobacter sputorum aubsp. sputorum RM3237]KAB0582580.1 LysM peptidoglycan-binding domain-containing protein [Campylobacter sputorum subsp. sputorum]QEL05882.1 membrane-bound lytic murein transglycosylase D [Campylobacter sputorum subsp. sputorum]SUX07872.1 regulatory protein dnir [Campylobacter sputorum subsp. bubulus]SUX10660.1 regulatory protein dnir [Cam
MRRIMAVLLCFIFTTQLFGYAKSSYINQIKVLKELDIDTRYASDPIFLSIKENITTSDKKEFIDIIQDGYSYIPMLKKIIDEADIPHSFLYLAMVESGLSNHAKSNASAVGMWQFMQETARLYGLKIDKYVDERKDPIAATKAAISYLKDLKGKFGKWYLAAIAYNCGEGRLGRAIKTAGSDDLTTLLDPQKKYLPLETRMFIRKILSAAYIAEDNDFIISNNSALLNRPNKINVTKVIVPGGTPLSQISDSIGLSLNKMKIYNPHLKNDITPPNTKNYYVYIPANKQGLFANNFDPKKQIKKNIYVVKNGDTISGIASRFNTDSRTIKDINSLKTDKLSINQELIVPALAVKNAKEISKKNYIIQKGDTLSGIAQKFSVSVKNLKSVNNIASSNLRIGEKIVIP